MYLSHHSAKDLITHLLCVDPAQRYTIDEFLAHPWCNAAPAPPPPPTPFAQRAYDSPMLSSGGNWEGMRSPGLATLKEAFDVTYAVHRMEEEGARRRKYRGAAAGPRTQLAELNEDDEMDSDASHASHHDGRSQPSRKLVGQHQDVHDSIGEGRAGPRDRGYAAAPAPATGGPTPKTRARRGFELDMDGATLLERRQRRAKANAGVMKNSPLRMQATDGTQRQQDPGSPMRI